MMEITNNVFLAFVWLSLSAGVLLPGIWLLFDGPTNLPILQRFYLFGKLKNANTMKRKLLTDVPKSSFLHFYLFGLATNICLFVLYRSTAVLFVLFFCHMLRRTYECIYVHRFGSNSTMSAIHYLVGLIHYPLVGLTIITDEQSTHPNISIITICFALVLFAVANSIQYRTHLTLATNRRTTVENYPIPNGYWLFKYISCPNYFAEIVIYISFFLLSHQTLCFMSLIVWVTINQCLSALFTHRWYGRHYGQKYHSLKRAAILPFIL